MQYWEFWWILSAIFHKKDNKLMYITLVFGVIAMFLQHMERVSHGG